MLSHINTYSKADLTDKQLSQEQKHGQHYFLDIMPHKLFAVEISLVTKRFCRAQIKSSTFIHVHRYNNRRLRHYSYNTVNLREDSNLVSEFVERSEVNPFPSGCRSCFYKKKPRFLKT